MYYLNYTEMNSALLLAIGATEHNYTGIKKFFFGTYRHFLFNNGNFTIQFNESELDQISWNFIWFIIEQLEKKGYSFSLEENKLFLIHDNEGFIVNSSDEAKKQLNVMTTDYVNDRLTLVYYTLYLLAKRINSK